MKLGTLQNPKFLRLARKLGCGKAAAAGHLEALWHFASEQAPAGDVGRWEDVEIEEACFWEGSEGALVVALVETGWLDLCAERRLIVHDWGEHASQMVKKRNQRAGIEFVEPKGDVGVISQRTEEPAASCGGEKEAEAQLSATAPDGGQWMPDGSRTADTVSRTADHQSPPDQSPPVPTRPVPSGAARAPSVSRSAPSAKSLCPDRLSTEDRESLIAWAKTKGFSESECRWAFNVVKDWSHGNGQRRASWLATTRNAMRDGWGLKGYRESDAERYQRELEASPFRARADDTDADAGRVH